MTGQGTTLIGPSVSARRSTRLQRASWAPKVAPALPTCQLYAEIALISTKTKFPTQTFKPQNSATWSKNVTIQVVNIQIVFAYK